LYIIFAHCSLYAIWLAIAHVYTIQSTLIAFWLLDGALAGTLDAVPVLNLDEEPRQGSSNGASSSSSSSSSSSGSTGASAHLSLEVPRSTSGGGSKKRGSEGVREAEDAKARKGGGSSPRLVTVIDLTESPVFTLATASPRERQEIILLGDNK
jgi:hypothetical protein